MMRWISLYILFVSSAIAEESAKVAEVQIFTSPDCPIANSYAPELKRLSKAYSPDQVTFHLIYPEVTLSEEEVEEHLSEYGLEIEARIDRTHALVRSAGVTTTPEVAVFDAGGDLVYRGLIDNLYSDYGDRKRAATEHYLREVLDSLVAGKTIAFSETEPIGCLIEPLSRSPAN